MIFNKMQNATNPMLTKIHNHPFNRELITGILPQDKFIFYLAQDALYLADYSRALSLTASKLSHHAHAQQFMQFALGAIQAERELHHHFLNKQTSLDLHNLEQSPACFMYTHYLLKTASLASVEEAAASLLPCFWVYREVGKVAMTESKPDNPFQSWIDLYAGNEFDASVNAAILIVNELAERSSNFIQEKMINAFIKSTQLEWMFWESAYHQEKWLFENRKII